MVSRSTSSFALIMELQPRASTTVFLAPASFTASCSPSSTVSITKAVPSPPCTDQRLPSSRACTGMPKRLVKSTLPSSFGSTWKISITNQSIAESFSAAIRPGSSLLSGPPYSLEFIYLPVLTQRNVWLPDPQSSRINTSGSSRRHNVPSSATAIPCSPQRKTTLSRPSAQAISAPVSSFMPSRSVVRKGGSPPYQS